MRRAALLFVALALAGCGGGGGNDEEQAAEPVPTVAAADGVEDLDNLLALRSDFEADAGKTRVIMLLSPT